MTPKELVQESIAVSEPPLPKADLPKPSPAEKPQAKQLVLGVLLPLDLYVSMKMSKLD